MVVLSPKKYSMRFSKKSGTIFCHCFALQVTCSVAIVYGSAVVRADVNDVSVGHVATEQRHAADWRQRWNAQILEHKLT